MKYYPKSTATIEAWQWDGTAQTKALIEAAVNTDLNSFITQPDGSARLWVIKSKAWCTLTVGDYIVCEPDGVGFYPCAKAIFEDKYETTGRPSQWDSALKRAGLR